MSKVLVIGAAGLLGQYIAQEALARGNNVLGTYKTTTVVNNCFRIDHLDITKLEEVRKVLSKFQPEAVILPSAMTNVDYCETHPEDAWEVNVEGTGNIASACDAIGSRLMYVSTDYVFDGEVKGRYCEADLPNPQSVYARTKLNGERIVLEADPRNSVCRVSVLYGWNKASPKSNFVSWVIDTMRKGNKVKLFGDQYVSPTYAPHCAKVLISMLERNARGLYHTSGPDCMNRYDMGLMIAEAFGLDPSLCIKIGTEDLPLPAKRCKNSCLNVSKAEEEFNIAMLPFTQGLKDMRSKEIMH